MRRHDVAWRGRASAWGSIGAVCVLRQTCGAGMTCHRAPHHHHSEDIVQRLFHLAHARRIIYDWLTGMTGSPVLSQTSTPGGNDQESQSQDKDHGGRTYTNRCVRQIDIDTDTHWPDHSLIRGWSPKVLREGLASLVQQPDSQSERHQGDDMPTGFPLCAHQDESGRQCLATQDGAARKEHHRRHDKEERSVSIRRTHPRHGNASFVPWRSCGAGPEQVGEPCDGN